MQIFWKCITYCMYRTISQDAERLKLKLCKKENELGDCLKKT